mgnify:CR=1 FL=1
MPAKKLAKGALIGALYALITLAAAPISSGLLQVRLSEGLCVLPYFFPEAVPGLFLGCLVANLVTGAMWMDVLFGSLATLLAAYLTYLTGKFGLSKWLAPAPAVLVNAVVVGLLLCYVYRVGPSVWVCMAYVAAGQAIACYGVGMPLMAALSRFGKRLF